MGRVIVGVFHTYSQAQAAVRDLEVTAGITGEQVEVISGADEDVRGVDAGLDRPHPQSIGERIAHFFRGLTGSQSHRVHDYYVEDQEFYAGEVRQGRTMLIVRPPSDREADVAIEVMRSHGGASVTGKKKLTVDRESDNPERVAPRATATTASTIGSPRVTTGNYADDLEGRGKELRGAEREVDVRVYAIGALLDESSEAAASPTSAPPTASSYDADYRRHYASSLMGSEAAYQVYCPAYEFGSRMADEERYRGRNYADAESDLRREYEASNPGNPWERFKEAIRHGWELATGKRARSAKP